MKRDMDLELFRRLLRIPCMGEITTRMRLENGSDVYLHGRRRLAKKDIRAAEVEAIVDTGAVMSLLPRDLVRRLGLSRVGILPVRLADDRTIVLERAGPIWVTVCGRSMSADCLVGPVGCAPLLGQLLLEGLDLIPDPKRRTITPRSPRQIINMRSLDFPADQVGQRLAPADEARLLAVH